jgi:hypothetical protein
VVDSSQSGTVPRLIGVSGVFQPANGQPPAVGTVVTLSLYADQAGGPLLWQEIQTVTVDHEGRFTLLLGATRPDGVPLDLFASGEARWLGMQFAGVGEVERPRTQITSVPYALRASDAATLGGRPPSAYLLAPTGGSGENRAAGAAGTVSASSASAMDVVLAGTPNYLAKYLDGDTVASSAVYEVGGTVGIGTTSPVDALHVKFTNTGGSATGLAVQNLGNTATSYSGMLFYDQNGALGQFQGFNNVTHEYRINNIASAGSINFMLGSSSKFLVASNGNIGIGTTIPAGSLEVSRTGSAAVMLETVYTNGNPNANAFMLTRFANGTPAAPAAVQSGDIIGAWLGSGYGATQFGSPTAGMAVLAQENWTDTAQGSSTGFFSTAIGSNQSQLHMAVLPSGNVGIGDLSSPGSTPSGDRLQVFGDIRVGDSGTNGCVKNFAGTQLTGTCPSDRRLKKNITPFGSVLDQVAALQPVHFDWRTTEFPDRHFGESRTYGLIAQDVEEVLPELVVTGKDGFKAVDYTELPLLTIQAVKELKAENDDLKAQNHALKDRITEIERLIREMRPASQR